MTIESQVKDAIARSISHSESVSLEIEATDISEVMTAIDCVTENTDTDYATENDGSYDVWGWTEETAENDQDWRLNVTIVAKGE